MPKVADCLRAWVDYTGQTRDSISSQVADCLRAWVDYTSMRLGKMRAKLRIAYGLGLITLFDGFFHQDFELRIAYGLGLITLILIRLKAGNSCGLLTGLG